MCQIIWRKAKGICSLVWTFSWFIDAWTNCSELFSETISNQKGILKCNTQSKGTLQKAKDLSSYLENAKSRIEVLEEMMNLNHSFYSPGEFLHMKMYFRRTIFDQRTQVAPSQMFQMMVLLRFFMYFRWEVLIWSACASDSSSKISSKACTQVLPLSLPTFLSAPLLQTLPDAEAGESPGWWVMTMGFNQGGDREWGSASTS